MCGICLLKQLLLTEKDYNVIEDMIQYYKSFEDSFPKPKNNENNTNQIINNNNSITSNESTNSIFPLLSAQFKEIIEQIGNRGPDYLSINCIENDKITSLSIDIILSLSTYKDIFEYITNNKCSLLINSVLSLRGIDELTKQPIYDSTNSISNVLQYNGEIYSISSLSLIKNKNLLTDNDGLILFDILEEISLQFSSIDKGDNKTYSDIFMQYITQIESDHALIYHDHRNKKIILNRDIFGKRSLMMVYIKSLNQLIITSILPNSFYLLRNSSDIITLEIPNNSCVIIDYLNETQKIFWYKNPYLQSPSILRFNLKPSTLQLDTLTNQCDLFLKSAVNKRISNIKAISSKNEAMKDSIAVLFSGGIDSLILAYYTVLLTPNYITIDLINLSFDASNAPDRNSGIIGYNELIPKFPDRDINLILIDKNYDNDITTEFVSKMKALIFPRSTHMDFNIASALSYATQLKGYKVDKEKMISYLKNNSVINTNSISESMKNNYSNNILSKQIEKIKYEIFTEMNTIYHSKAKVVLSGLGADEFFGGYSRYRNGNIEENMKKDIDRIWMRNFGRDDRACSNNGIELRFPFFDNELINFLSQIKDIEQVTNFKLQRGIGEKMLLRNVAKMKGFDLCYMFEKRAIQFGTKLAHETNVKKYGSNGKANGKAQFI